MRRYTTLAVAAAAGVVFSAFLATAPPRTALAHCEVPCGIYDDHARIGQMLEDATTVGKAVDQVMMLEGRADAQSVNQMVRWVTTKDDHATRIQDTIAQYYLTQRVKAKDRDSAEWNDYVTRLTEHHRVMVAAMKTKQTVDPAAVDDLHAAITAIAKYYPAPDHDHDHGHPHTRGG